MIAEGSLQDFSLSDLLQIISLNGSTGTLRLSSEGREGVLDCLQGEIIGAVAPGLEGEEAIYAIFHWESGTFDFASDAGPTLPNNVKLSLGEFTKEGIRRLDHWRSIRRDLPVLTMRARFRSERAELLGNLGSHATEVWAVIAGHAGMTVAEIARLTTFSELTVAQALLELYREGMVLVETSPEEALRSMFQRASEEVYTRFASISGLKMTEGLETLLNEHARAKGVDLRWRSGRVHDGLPSVMPAADLRGIYRDFLVQELEYVTRIHGQSFTEKALDEAIAGFSPEEKTGWLALELPAAMNARIS